MNIRFSGGVLVKSIDLYPKTSPGDSPETIRDKEAQWRKAEKEAKRQTVAKVAELLAQGKRAEPVPYPHQSGSMHYLVATGKDAVDIAHLNTLLRTQTDRTFDNLRQDESLQEDPEAVVEAKHNAYSALTRFAQASYELILQKALHGITD